MPDLPTRLDLYALGRGYVLQNAKRIDPGIVDTAGSDVNLFVGSGSVMADAVVKQIGYQTARVLLDGADGEDLDRLAYDRYGITRKGASSALGEVIFTRPAVGASGSIIIGTKLRTAAGIEYITTSTASFSSGDLISRADVRAVQAGKTTQVGANNIQAFTQAGLIFDKSITPNNPLTTAGGEDAEDDETFKNRIRNFWNTARRGILAAIEFGATTVDGVVSAVAIETLGVDEQPARLVNLYIADSSGVASEQLAAQVRVALNDYRAAGIAVIVYTTLPVIVNITLSLSFRANVDTVSITENVQNAIVEFVNSLPVNGTLYRNAMGAVLQRFTDDGLIANDQSVLSPAGDLVPGIGQTFRTTAANVVVTTP